MGVDQNYTDTSHEPRCDRTFSFKNPQNLSAPISIVSYWLSGWGGVSEERQNYYTVSPPEIWTTGKMSTIQKLAHLRVRTVFFYSVTRQQEAKVKCVCCFWHMICLWHFVTYIYSLGGGFNHFLIFTSKIWEHVPISQGCLRFLQMVGWNHQLLLFLHMNDFLSLIGQQPIVLGLRLVHLQSDQGEFYLHIKRWLWRSWFLGFIGGIHHSMLDGGTSQHFF